MNDRSTAFALFGGGVRRMAAAVTALRRALCATAPGGARASCSVEIPLADGGPPEWITLLPAGPIDARDGRRWLNDRPEAVVAATRARAGTADLVVDYEHQTDYAPQNGQSAPAAGWIKEIRHEDGQVRARVEWTARAAAHIAAREYRYISPVHWHDEDPPHRIRAIERVALTNSPAITDLPALARTHTRDDPTMPDYLKKFLERFQLTDGSSQAEVDEAASRLDARAGVPDRKSLASALGLTEDACNEEAILAKATALATAAAGSGTTVPDPSRYVPIEQHNTVVAQLSTLTAERAEEKALAAVDTAVVSGKIIPATRGWALDYARRDLEGFEAYLKDAPVILAPGARTSPAPGDGDTLTDTEKALCRRMGLTEEKFKQQRATTANGG